MTTEPDTVSPYYYSTWSLKNLHVGSSLKTLVSSKDFKPKITEVVTMSSAVNILINVELFMSYIT